MDRKRLFIALPIPPHIRAELLAYQEEWSDLPLRWTTEESLHITLLFLGWTPTRALDAVTGAMQEIAETHHAFDITFSRIMPGPPQEPPRLVWVDGSAQPEGDALYDDLADALHDRDVDVQGYRSSWNVHCTLGRLSGNPSRSERERITGIDETVHLQFGVHEMELKESHRKRSGAEYVTLETAALQP